MVNDKYVRDADGNAQQPANGHLLIFIRPFRLTREMKVGYSDKAEGNDYEEE